MNKRLFVAGLPFETTEAELKELFTKAGVVVSATIIIDKFSGRSKGFGFVEMETPEEATNAITTLNETDFGGRKLIVAEAKPQEKENTQMINAEALAAVEEVGEDLIETGVVDEIKGTVGEIEEEVTDNMGASVAIGSVCTRCGKPRIVKETYEEKIETSTVTYTIKVCSDAECQKIVDGQLHKEKQQRQVIKKEQEIREAARKVNLARKKLEKAK